MTKLILPRRAFLVGAASALAAPAIVRATSLMPVQSIERFTTLAQRDDAKLYERYAVEYELFGHYVRVSAMHSTQPLGELPRGIRISRRLAEAALGSLDKLDYGGSRSLATNLPRKQWDLMQAIERNGG